MTTTVFLILAAILIGCVVLGAVTDYRWRRKQAAQAAAPEPRAPTLFDPIRIAMAADYPQDRREAFVKQIADDLFLAGTLQRDQLTVIRALAQVFAAGRMRDDDVGQLMTHAPQLMLRLFKQWGGAKAFSQAIDRGDVSARLIVAAVLLHRRIEGAKVPDPLRAGVTGTRADRVVVDDPFESATPAQKGEARGAVADAVAPAAPAMGVGAANAIVDKIAGIAPDRGPLFVSKIRKGQVLARIELVETQPIGAGGETVTIRLGREIRYAAGDVFALHYGEHTHMPLATWLMDQAGRRSILTLRVS